MKENKREEDVKRKLKNVNTTLNERRVEIK
jgi:hypothetical protein